MHSWVFRHRVQLARVYQHAPEPLALPEPPSHHDPERRPAPVPCEELACLRSPSSSDELLDDLTLLPAPRRAG
jgi:hypothetical protein